MRAATEAGAAKSAVSAMNSTVVRNPLQVAMAANVVGPSRVGEPFPTAIAIDVDASSRSLPAGGAFATAAPVAVAHNPLTWLAASPTPSPLGFVTSGLEATTRTAPFSSMHEHGGPTRSRGLPHFLRRTVPIETDTSEGSSVATDWAASPALASPLPAAVPVHSVLPTLPAPPAGGVIPQGYHRVRRLAINNLAHMEAEDIGRSWEFLELDLRHSLAQLKNVETSLNSLLMQCLSGVTVFILLATAITFPSAQRAFVIMFYFGGAIFGYLMGTLTSKTRSYAIVVLYEVVEHLNAVLGVDSDAWKKSKGACGWRLCCCCCIVGAKCATFSRDRCMAYNARHHRARDLPTPEQHPTAESRPPNAASLPVAKVVYRL